MSVRLLVIAIGILAASCVGRPAAADCPVGKLRGTAAKLSDWSDDRPGRCRRILPSDLQPASKSNTSFSKIVPAPTGVLPRVPAGFRVSRIFRSGAQPRLLRTAPNGDIFVAESAAGQIRILRPSSTCKLGTTALFATGLDRPFGMAFYPAGDNPQYLYVAENSRVVRYPYASGGLAPGGAAEVVVAKLPQGAGELPGKGHWTRDIVFSADGSTMYVSVGSYSNVQQNGEDETDRAAILSFTPTGDSHAIFATGLRNPVSLSIQPVTGALWTTVNERDGLGDQLVPDYVTEVRANEFFGWPWYYIGQRRDTRPRAALPTDLPPVTVPSVLLQAHTASLGAAFYTGSQFPAEYKHSLFIAAHGSWNRANPTGSKVIRVAFDAAGNAVRYYEDFMTGFTVSNHNVWGRPVGIAIGKDGSLFVSEDANKSIYCVSYTG